MQAELETGATTAAKRLIGCELIRTFPEGEVRVRIVETESYDQHDMASHSFNGKTNRNAVMFGPAGTLYVYFTYGMHYCCNVVTGKQGDGSAVLIRAVEPIAGQTIIEKYRKKIGLAATNGPAKLCQALSINTELNGHILSDAPLKLVMGRPVNDSQITVTTRVGISKAAHEARRFYLTESRYVSQR